MSKADAIVRSLSSGRARHSASAKTASLQCTALREEAIERFSQLPMLRKRELRIRLQYEGRILRSFPEELSILIDVCDGEIQCTRLTDTEDVARSPKPEILLCDVEAVV